VTLEVAGRRSGRAVRFPLWMADSDGEWYLVAMLGEQCNWVQNVRAAGARAGDSSARAGRGLPARRSAGVRAHIPVDRHAPTADFDAISSRYPVFRVVLDTSPDSTPAASVGQQPTPIEDVQR
jgi:hypothetical protein